MAEAFLRKFFLSGGRERPTGPNGRPEAHEPGRSLAELHPGQNGRIKGLSLQGPARSRLLDLGFVPGTPVEAVMESPAGDLTAYRIRGSTIALRRDQARHIGIE
jgi:ferrous iron transport protein A